MTRCLARKNREQIFSGPHLDELVRHLSCVEADVLARAPISCRPLTAPNRRRRAWRRQPVRAGSRWHTEARDGWNLQPLESIEALFASVCAFAGRIQIVSKENCRRTAQASRCALHVRDFQKGSREIARSKAASVRRSRRAKASAQPRTPNLPRTRNQHQAPRTQNPEPLLFMALFLSHR